MDLVAAGQRALDVARSLWAQRIVDPPRSTWQDARWRDSREAIDTMIRGRTGLGWPRCSWVPPVVAYRHDGDYEWCGAGAAYCWRVGAGLDPELAHLYWSSTYRLDRYARRAFAFWSLRERALVKRLDGAGRKVLDVALVADSAKRLRPVGSTLDQVMAWGPRAGDILTIDTTGRAKWRIGHHVCIVEELDARRQVIHTYEANATGTGPDGTVYQGFVRGERPLREWRRLIRPGDGDLTEARS